MNTKKIASAALGAALMMGLNGANAASPSKGQIAEIQLDGNCDVLTLTIFPWHQAGMSDDSCDGVGALGSGMEGKVVGVSPKNLTIGETYFGDPTATYLLNIQHPLKTGNSWSIFRSTDGAHFTAMNSGTYTILGADRARLPRVGPPAHRPQQR